MPEARLCAAFQPTAQGGAMDRICLLPFTLTAVARRRGSSLFKSPCGFCFPS